MDSSHLRSPPESGLPVRAPRGRQVAAWLLAAVLVNSAIGLALTVLSVTGNPFVHNWTYSQAIGLTTWALIAGPRWLLWPRRAPPAAAMVAVSVAGTALGFLIGDAAASRLLGVPRIAAAAAGRPLWPALITTLLAAAAGTTWFWTRERVAALQLRAAHERTRAEAALRTATDAQLHMLRAQLEPHMLFNTLANLRALIAVDPVRAQSMLDRLIAYLRATLAAARQDRTTLAEEFALLDDYLSLIAVRMGARLRYTLDLPAALANIAVPPMLLQPLVENAVRHGIEPAIEGGSIAVSASREHDMLILSVADTGIGLDQAASRESGQAGSESEAVPDAASRFGLAHIRERLAALFGGIASLSIGPARCEADADSRGALVVLRLPLKTST